MIVDADLRSADHLEMGRYLFWIVLALLAIVIWAFATGRAQPILDFVRGTSEQVMPTDLDSP